MLETLSFCFAKRCMNSEKYLSVLKNGNSDKQSTKKYKKEQKSALSAK